jgi:hypothetical protein
VAIGHQAATSGQAAYAIAVGYQAGSASQATGAIAVGYGAGFTGQSSASVALGFDAGRTTQGRHAVAVGYQAGLTNQGQNAIAIGIGAGQTSQPSDSIILNAKATQLDAATSGFFVNPVTADPAGDPAPTSGGMYYHKATHEIKYNDSKTFVIDHPLDPQRYLVHACLEGPEAGVYYRGESELIDVETRITLPDYVHDMADNFTVQLTQILRGPEDSFARLGATRVDDDGSFTVRGDPCAFAWHVHGTRQYIDTAPLKTEVHVVGDGPYRYIQ